VILLDLFSFTDLREIQFTFIIIVFVNDTDHFSFLLMNVFKTDVKINEILIRILNIVNRLSVQVAYRSCESELNLSVRSGKVNFF